MYGERRIWLRGRPSWADFVVRRPKSTLGRGFWRLTIVRQWSAMREPTYRPSRSTILRELLRPDERAIEAVVARYQKVAPAVTRFARALSGNDKLRVVLGPEAAASQNEVVCDPRLFQAATNRAAPVTPDEMALASALHEVVHLISSDFDAPDSEDAPDAEGDLLRRLDVDGGPVAEVLFFSLEDARQELQGLVNYPGARSVLADIYQAALSGAFSQSGPLGQFALCCFLLTGDYNEREAWSGESTARCSGRWPMPLRSVPKPPPPGTPPRSSTWPWPCFRSPRPTVSSAKSRSRGRPPSRECNRRRTPRAAAEGVDMVRLPSPSVRDSESYRDVQRATQARSGLSDRKGASELAGDASTDQLLRVSEAPTVYSADRNGWQAGRYPGPQDLRRVRQRGTGRGRLRRQEVGRCPAPCFRGVVSAVRRQPTTGASLGIRPGRRFPTCGAVHRGRSLRPNVRAESVAHPAFLCREPARRRIRLDAATTHQRNARGHRGACRRRCWER